MMSTPTFSLAVDASALSSAVQAAQVAPRRRRARCLPRPPRGSRAARPRRAPSSPSSRSRSPRRRGSPPRRRPAWRAAPAASRGRSPRWSPRSGARICLMRPSMSAFLPAPSMMVVLSLSTTIRLARPRSLSVTFSSLMPRSSAITLPPVRIAMSSSMALRRSPKPGAFTAAHVQRAAQLVDHQGRQRLALDVLGDDEQRLARPARSARAAAAGPSSTEIFFSWIRM